MTAHHFGKLLTETGVQILDDDEAGDPAGAAWSEAGDLDSAGHDQSWTLARRIDEQVRELAERVAGLLHAGWAVVKVVTDHGWLLMPGGLPKTQLPTYLADTRWGRCALLKPGSKPSGLIVHWRWSSEALVALAPGVTCYREGMAYAHGGLSLQECLTPVLTVRAGVRVGTDATVTDVTWRGLRCKIVGGTAGPDLRVDLRTRPADPESSIVGGGKALAPDGRASCVVEGDALVGTAAVVVLLDANGTVVAKAPTTVGGGD